MKNKSLISVLALSATLLVLTAALFSINKSTQKKDNVVKDEDEQIYQPIDSSEGADDNSSLVNSENTATNNVTSPIVTEPIVKTISFIAAGDNIVHQAVMDDAKRLANEKGLSDSFYFDSMYENLKELISDADIAFINQEGPIAGKALGYSGYPAFNAPNQAGDALVNLGFDIVNIANNHMLDKGEKGYKNSIDYWKTKPIMLVGGYESQEDFNTIRYYEYEGIKIALLSYTYGTNGYYLPASSKMWVPYYNENDIVNKHAKQARNNADIVIALMHWGDENKFKPNEIQKKYANILVNNNVDVVIGTHPHVLQPIEWKQRPDGKKTLIAYSIGNLLSTMHNSRNMVGGLLTFNIKYTEPSDAEISDVKLIPTMCYYSQKRDSLKLYELSEFTEDMYYTHGSTLQENVSYESMISYVTDTINAEFLDDSFLKSISE